MKVTGERNPLPMGSVKVTVLARVEKAVCQIPGKGDVKLSPSQRLKEDLDIDSQDTVEMVIALEEEFGVHFDDDQAAKITTVQGLIDYIETLT